MNSLKKPASAFVNRHIGSKENEIQSMLNELKFTSLNYLTNTIVPENIHCNSSLNLPKALSETETKKRLYGLARRNSVYRSYIGMGYYGTVT
ncbi:uncharacterized protein METZ01_LOCUS314723, partial [marine metagenome]